MPADKYIIDAFFIYFKWEELLHFAIENVLYCLYLNTLAKLQ